MLTRLRNVVLYSAVALAAPVSAFAQTAGTGTPPADETAAGVLSASGVDLTQLPTAVGLGASAVIGVAIAMSVLMILRRLVRTAR